MVMVNLSTNIQNFLSAHQLSAKYAQQIDDWFAEVVKELVLHQKGAKRPIIIGIHGAQGSGKSTLAECLVHILTTQHHKSAIALSLDDFYLTHQQRVDLANTVHPLLATRGVPGTHDVELALSTLDKLLSQRKNIAIPRFDKAHDDRFPVEQWPVLESAPKFIVLEGWCMGACPQPEEALTTPINKLEQSEDPDAYWRHFVNQKLEQEYQALFQRVDSWIMLKAPNFDCIYDWRLEQEEKLQQVVSSTENKIMNADDIARFIQYYQRVTQHCLDTLPEQMDYVFELNMERDIVALKRPKQSPPGASCPKASLLVFTDLDGSLLDHHNYRHDEADPVLERLKQLQIPLIPVSSKTQSEIEQISESLENPHPFICENGAAVFIPVNYFSNQPTDTKTSGKYWIKEFVQPRSHWQSIIKSVEPLFNDDFTTFAQAGIDGIIAMTGLDVHAAARAARRQYGEALAWHGNPRKQKQFIEEVRKRGAQVLIGGRFMHVSGQCDKGKAIQWLKQVYENFCPDKRFTSLAIGDSQNDVAMLETADMALLIPSPVNALPLLKRHHDVMQAAHCGPRGWAEGVQQVLQQLHLGTALVH
ncbi:Glucosyl-3-phosphoglycerate/mannosyl-3-phosphoglycerate phosphatase [Methylophaga muralis]|uniref:Glucosyl-3-phosphoglycerate/mannosyl-3-phosphoglycerate phosphatase n=2 Tax=Methylophaga muralis TaxID=291169 RepID=A0A1E3GQ11_9GAMM|nr:Glucosyl-3-phosphoglycerate/mannosyl-3-phosphoglycerate phosphatase [Methylophaga muralis]